MLPDIVQMFRRMKKIVLFTLVFMAFLISADILAQKSFSEIKLQGKWDVIEIVNLKSGELAPEKAIEGMSYEFSKDSMMTFTQYRYVRKYNYKEKYEISRDTIYVEDKQDYLIVKKLTNQRLTIVLNKGIVKAELKKKD